MRHEKYYMSEKGGPDTRDPLWMCLKCVCVYINSKLSWNYHVDAITTKASSTLWFLNRNTAHCCDVKEYCC